MEATPPLAVEELSVLPFDDGSLPHAIKVSARVVTSTERMATEGTQFGGGVDRF